MMPIFIITCDRLTCTREAIVSYRECIGQEFDLVIVDFGSTYQPLLEYLRQLEDSGIKIYWKDAICNANQLNGVSMCIEDYFKSHPTSNYVVTDPDIELDNTPDDILDIYSYFLDTFHNANVVGPMLRIDDIPDCYPLKEQLISGKRGYHGKFHAQPVNVIYRGNTKLEYIFAPIDTTFGMYRTGAKWARLKFGIRVLPPYGARHLDWYVDPNNLTPDQKYYMEHASKGIANWSQLKGVTVNG